MSGSSPYMDNIHWMQTGEVQEEKRTSTDRNIYQRMATDTCRILSRLLFRWLSVKSFEHAQNFPPDKTDFNGYHRTNNG